MRVDKSVDSDSMTSLPLEMDVVIERCVRHLETPLTPLLKDRVSS
jgi:hypothetical protein